MKKQIKKFNEFVNENGKFLVSLNDIEIFEKVIKDIGNYNALQSKIKNELEVVIKSLYKLYEEGKLKTIIDELENKGIDNDALDNFYFNFEDGKTQIELEDYFDGSFSLDELRVGLLLIKQYDEHQFKNK